MKRRSLLFALFGVGVGWIGATEFGGRVEGPTDGPPANATSNAQAPGGPNATDMTGANASGSSTTAVASAGTTTSDGTTTNPNPKQTPSPETRAAESTTEPTSTATATPDSTATRDLRKKVTVYSQGHAGDSGRSYSVLYVVRNEWDFSVRVTFEATVSLRGGSNRRKNRSAVIDPGSVANDSFEFSKLPSKATGWSFQLTSVSRP